MIKLSVIIPTFNRRHVLERTLPALLAQDLPPEDYELIVVVDGSTDGTVDLLRGLKPRCAFRALQAPHRCAGAARNVGIWAAVGDLVLFLDDDLITAPDLFRQHCTSHSDSDDCVVHGPIYVAPGSSQTIVRQSVENFYDSYYRSLNPDMVLRYPEDIASSIMVLSSLVNSSMPRDLLLRCRGFDEQFVAAEDLELGLRLWKMGVLFRFRSEAIAYELHVKSSRQYLQTQARALGTGDLIAARKHSEYRPHSRLSAFAETQAPKKWLLNALIGFPVSPVAFLSLPLFLERCFYRIAPMRNAGLRLFRMSETVAIMRNAQSSAGSWKDLKSEFDRRLPVLMYHHVGPSRPGTDRAMTISPKQFEKQMRWLARRGYAGIRPCDWLRWRREGAGLPKKPILLTFDDAYSDTADYALPILRRYGFGAAVFVVSQRIGGTNTWDEADGSGTLQLMTSEQIRHWAGQGIEFGAHSRTHADLTKLSATDCSAEVVGSKNDLSALLGSPVVSFAYPYGEYNDTAANLVRGHFDLGFSTEEGMNFLRGAPHLLRRAYVGPDDSLLEFALGVHCGKLKVFRDWRVRLGVYSRLKRAVKLLLRPSTNGGIRG